MNIYDRNNQNTLFPTQYGLITLSLEEPGLIIKANSEFYHLIGYTSNEIEEVFGNDINNIVLKEDRISLKEMYTKANQNQNFKVDLRIKKKDESILSILLFGSVIIYEEGTSVINAMFLDMTTSDKVKMSTINSIIQNFMNEMKEIKDKLEIEKERSKVLIHLNSNTVFEYDKNKDSISFYSNNKNNKLNGTKISDVKQMLKGYEKIHEEDRERCISFLEGETEHDIEFRYYNEEGSYVWYLAKGIVINRTDATKKSILIGCIYNINEQKLKKEKLMNESRIDSLTGLYNNIYTRKKIEEYLESEGRHSFHTLLIIDIDNFTIVNEHLGYLFADTVLTNIAEQLKKIFNHSDIIGRIGGDKFLVFITNESNEKYIIQKAKEICSICLNTYTGENKEINISCSIGLTRYPQDGMNYLELFKNADLALYQAKKMGKNNFQFFIENRMSHLKNEEYYNKYHIDQNSKQSVSNFDKEITNFAFDIMTKTKDVNSAIYLLLDRVAKHFDVSHVWIMEKKVDDTSLNITYLWSKDRGMHNKDKNMMRTNLTQEDYHDLFDENGIFYISDCSISKDSLDKYQLTGVNAKAILECGIFEDNTFKGCVCIDDCEKTRLWSSYEVNSLVNITKIISSYLLKMRASDRTQKRLDKMKNYDSLTNLPTLHKFKKDVKEIIETNPLKEYAIVYSDISNFKYVNNTLGFEEGDIILCDFARIITSDALKSECVGRISSDKFVILMEYTEKELLRSQIIEVSEQFNAEQKAKNLNLNLAIISGICILNSEYSDIMTAIDNANTARKSLRASLKSVCKYYDPSMQEKIKKEMEIVNSMENALQNQEFIMYLQPKICLKDNRLVGAEALVRWKKDGIIVPPNDFIPIFEKNGFIVNLDFYIYEEACKLLRSWLNKGLTTIPISVNVSRVHLNDEKFVTNFSELVNSYQIPPHLLELELTESIFLDNTETAITTMKKFRNLGYGVSIDDFGAGFSSLNLLKDMTTDVLKLDKEFFRQGEMQKEDQIIVSSIINMAKQLNMKVLSEGVETQMQSDFLRGISCDMAQGYLYAKPMPIKEFEQLIIEKNI